ncbi:hypothetical protein SS50377_28293 [Spironucleus salmonicida]|uniref:Uncharacterized protein n=1 Tax=Spironucleus salmonicida TaxID=348837 RepID=V6LZF5_9EUKA|nr:hypothetical protein SS50377_28293 [Spironucleus salmonicida]|eukprot:EST49136.1 Hypothetical protein SS50377_10576 [Spironucleus salmonicida]
MFVQTYKVPFLEQDFAKMNYYSFWSSQKAYDKETAQLISLQQETLDGFLVDKIKIKLNLTKNVPKGISKITPHSVLILDCSSVQSDSSLYTRMSSIEYPEQGYFDIYTEVSGSENIPQKYMNLMEKNKKKVKTQYVDLSDGSTEFCYIHKLTTLKFEFFMGPTLSKIALYFGKKQHTSSIKTSIMHMHIWQNLTLDDIKAGNGVQVGVAIDTSYDSKKQSESD